MADNRMSNTMEINSILEEARSRNQAAQKQSAPKSAPTSAPRTSGTTRRKADDDEYVDISKSASLRSAPQTQAKPKKSKKPLVITLVVILVLVLAGVGGFTWFSYQNSGSSTIVAKDVTVNGVDIGGKTMDEARKALSGIEESLANGIKVDVKAGDKTLSLTKDDFKYSFNTDEIFNQIKAFSEEKSLSKEAKSYEISMKVDNSANKAIAEKLAKEVHADPTDAKVTAFDSSADDMFTFQKEVVGQDLDQDDLVTKINGLFNAGKTSGSVEAKLNTVEPKRTVNYLRKNIKKLSSFSTDSTNNSNGNENMRVSLKACNNSIIEPGETWSFNDCTGDSNLESNGYLPAGVIVEGRSETGVGGGICQSSTTIYNATLLCGMEVIERECHYYKSTYVDAGRDATIDYGNIDLKMKNPFDYQLFMECWMDGTELNCVMYGLENPDFDDVKLSFSDPDYFSTGYTVEGTRTFYKDDKKVSSEDLPSSTYYTVAPSSSSGSSSDDDDDDDDDSSSDSGSGSDSGSNSSSSSDSGSTSSTGSDSGSGDTGSDSGDSGAGSSGESGGSDAGSQEAGGDTGSDTGNAEGGGGETPG